MKFSDCIDIVGFKPPRFKGIRRYISTGAVDTNKIKEELVELVTYDNRPSRADLMGESGDLIFAKMADTNKVLILDNKTEKNIYSTGFLMIRPKKNVINKKCLFYLLVSKMFQEQKNQYSSGTTQRAITNKGLDSIVVKIPDISMQSLISEQFEVLANVIAMRKTQIQELDTLIKARFVEMFGDPVRNPRGWYAKRLGDLSTQINSGNTPKGGEQVYVDKGIIFFRSQNVWKDRLEMNDIAYIDETTHARMSKSSLKYGDILITKTGRINTENSSLGRAALYTGKDDMANINGHVYFIRLKPDVNNKFILRILVSDEYRDYIRSVCVGGIDKRQLNKEHIENFPIICPPKTMVEEHITFVEKVDKLKVVHYIIGFFRFYSLI